MAGENAVPPVQPQSSLSFTQGFVLGQLSVVILIGAFIKFFIFGETPPSDSSASARLTSRRARTIAHKQSLSSSLHSTPQKLKHKRSTVLRNPPALTTATILSKTYYNVQSHQPESLDWFNVLVAQTIAQFRNDAQHDDAILGSLNEVLNGDQRPGFVGDIRVTEISLGEEFPIFSNCRVWPMDDDKNGNGRLQARMDVDLSDFITLGVETRLILNYPKPMTAVLPVALAVSIVRFSGTLSISFIPSTSPAAPSPTTLAFSFLDDYRLDLSVRSLVGSRSRLQDVPKIAQLVEARLHTWFDERCVEPRFQQIVLPSLWPRKKNTRGGDEEVPEATVRERDVMEEARAEVEAERKERERLEQEGIRWRGRGNDGYETMPGAMPGMLVS